MLKYGYHCTTGKKSVIFSIKEARPLVKLSPNVVPVTFVFQAEAFSSSTRMDSTLKDGWHRLFRFNKKVNAIKGLKA